MVNSISTSSVTPIHTSITSSTAYDEIYIYATNNSNSPAALTMCWGGTGSVNQLPIGIPNSVGRVCVCDGMLLNNSLIASAYASISNSILIDGFVNRIQ